MGLEGESGTTDTTYQSAALKKANSVKANLAATSGRSSLTALTMRANGRTVGVTVKE